MDVIRGAFKIVICVLTVTSFLFWSYFCHLIYWNPDKRLKRFSKNVQMYSKFLLKVMNLKLIVKNLPPSDFKCLVVSNHMGIIDILMLASIYPMIFVTSNEMRETPGLGWITEMGGSIYVERRSRTKIVDELHHIAKFLRKGFRVTLYPEAKATNGEVVLPFKKTLLMAAGEAGVPVQPVVVNFREVNGIQGFPLKYRDSLCWYGDLPFVKSVWGAAQLKSVVGEVEFLEPLSFAPDADRTYVAETLHHRIASKYVPPF